MLRTKVTEKDNFDTTFPTTTSRVLKQLMYTYVADGVVGHFLVSSFYNLHHFVDVHLIIKPLASRNEHETSKYREGFNISHTTRNKVILAAAILQ